MDSLSLTPRNTTRSLTQYLCVTYPTVTTVEHGVSQKATLAVLKRITDVTFTASSASTTLSKSATRTYTSAVHKTASNPPDDVSLETLWSYFPPRTAYSSSNKQLRYYDSAGNLPTHRGRTPTCLPAVLDKDLRLDITSSLRLRNTADLYALSHIAQDCALWKELTQRLCNSQELIYRNIETVRPKQKLESANTDLMPPRKRT